MTHSLAQTLTINGVSPTAVSLQSVHGNAVVGTPFISISITYAEGSEDNFFAEAPAKRYRVLIEEITDQT